MSQLEQECQRLGNEIVDLTTKRENLDKRFQEKRAAIEARQKKESEFFNMRKDKLAAFLKEHTGQ